jgi:hypothetical protein
MTPATGGRNNFAYIVTFAPGSNITQSKKPGTVALPDGTKKLIIRISNAEANLNEAVRVENEVAAMVLMRSALAGFGTRIIVPDVYDWKGTSDDQQGYIVEQFMEGEQFSEEFGELKRDDQKKLLDQISDIFKAIQTFGLPDSIRGFGGLGFDEAGKIVTGPTAIPCGGPFASVEDMYAQFMRFQIEMSERCSLIDGWKANGVRERLERFHAEGLPALIERLKDQRPTLIHGDFGTYSPKSNRVADFIDPLNMLYDKETMTITALLDYDFAHIASPEDEYFYSFYTIHGTLGGHHDPDKAALELLDRQVNGFPSDIPDERPDNSKPRKFGDDSRIDWVIASTWDKLLREKQIKSPSSLEGVGAMDGIQNLYWLIQDICQPFLLMDRWLATQTPEKLEKMKAKLENSVRSALDGFGY